MKITAVSAAFTALAAVIGTVNSVPMPTEKPTSTGLSTPIPLVDINGTHTHGHIIPPAGNITRPSGPQFTFTQTITVTVSMPTDLPIPWEVVGGKPGNKTFNPIQGPPHIPQPPKTQPVPIPEIPGLNFTGHLPTPKSGPPANPFTNPQPEPKPKGSAKPGPFVNPFVDSHPEPKPKADPWLSFNETGPIPTARPTLVHEHGRPFVNITDGSKPKPDNNAPFPSLVHDHRPNPEPEVSEASPVPTTAATTSPLFHDHGPPHTKPSEESKTTDTDKPAPSLHNDRRPNPELNFTEANPVATASTTSPLFHDHAPPNAKPSPETVAVTDHHKHGGPISIRTGPAIEGFEKVTRVKCIVGEVGVENHEDEAVACLENFTCKQNLDITPREDSKLEGDSTKYCFDKCECQQNSGGTTSPKDKNQPRQVNKVDPKFPRDISAVEARQVVKVDSVILTLSPTTTAEKQEIETGEAITSDHGYDFGTLIPTTWTGPGVSVVSSLPSFEDN